MNLKECETLEDVKREVKSCMTYYNHYRGQWNFKKLPPVKYRLQLQQVAEAFLNVLYNGTLYQKVITL